MKGIVATVLKGGVTGAALVFALDAAGQQNEADAGPRPDWRDEYRYDVKGRLEGWTRIRGTTREEFAPAGFLVRENLLPQDEVVGWKALLQRVSVMTTSMIAGIQR